MDMLRTWLNRLADFLGHPYRLFDVGVIAVAAGLCLYVLRTPSQPTDAMLSGTGLAVLGSHTWGWALVVVGLLAIAVSGAGYVPMVVGYVALFSVTGAWAALLFFGGWWALLHNVSTLDDAWGSTGAAFLWGGASSHLWAEILRLRREAQECGHP